ncbi:MAG: hypothetical protein QM483_01130 [Desulfuromusa sp.]
MKRLLTLVLILFLCGIFPIVAVAAENTPPQLDPALELIHALGCKGCHMISGDGGSLAQDLTQIGSRLTANQIEAHLTADPATRTKGFMPSYHSLPATDLQRIGEYLYNLR